MSCLLRLNNFVELFRLPVVCLPHTQRSAVHTSRSAVLAAVGPAHRCTGIFVTMISVSVQSPCLFDSRKFTPNRTSCNCKNEKSTAEQIDRSPEKLKINSIPGIDSFRRHNRCDSVTGITTTYV